VTGRHMLRRNSRRLLTGCSLVGFALLPGAVNAQERAAAGAVVVGSPAPDAALRTLDGATVSLRQQIAGRPALLEFWATWCSTCTELEPTIRAVATKYRERLTVVGVAVATNQSPSRVKRYVATHRLPGLHLFDADGAARDAFGAPGTSYVVVVNRAGTVVYIGIGGTQDLDRAVEKALLP
jgi:thiol-disulfide isomerase/thioredoxin